MSLDPTMYIAAFHASATPLGFVDERRRWLEVNDALCALLGRDRAALVGADCLDLAHPEDADAIARAIASGDARPSEARWVGAAGATLHTHLAFAPLPGARGGMLRMINISELRASQQAELQRGERAAMQRAAMLELASAGGDELEAVLRRILRRDAQTLGVQRVSYWSLSPEKSALRCVLLYDSASDSTSAGAILESAAYPAYFAALADQPLIVVDDAHSDPRTCEFTASYLRPMGIGALLDVPVWTNGRLAGVLCHEHVGAARAWHNDEAEFATSVGHLVSLALETQARLTFEAALLRAKEIAEEATAAKSRFLANLSHEFRTPLNGVLGMTELALATPLDSDQRAFISTARGSALGLLALVEDLLDLSSIEAGRFALRERSFAPASLVAEAIAPLRGRAAAKGVALELLAEEGLPPLRGDADRLRQIVLNLVSNAVKFTHHGRVEVRLQAGERAGARLTLALTVRDSGIGIPPDMQGRIFEPFIQVDPAEARRSGGLGLGLSITAQLVAAMSGAMTVDSRPNAGSTFQVRLPFAVEVAAIPPEEPAPLAAPAWAAGRPRVAVVDDDPIGLQVSARLLTQLGCEVRAFASAEALLADPQLADLEIALTDIRLPGLDGLEALPALRARWGDRHVPVIALTAQAMPGDRDRLLAAGFDDYLCKPIVGRALATVLARWREPAEPGEAEPVPHEVIEVFEATLPERMTALEHAATRGALDELGALAHQLLGSLLVVNAGDRPVSSARALESSANAGDRAGSLQALAGLQVALAAVAHPRPPSSMEVPG